MQRLAISIWIVVASTLMGACVLVVLIVPQLAMHEMKLVLPAALLGAVIAVPISYVISKKLRILFRDPEEKI